VTFAYPLPWWLAALLAVVVAAIALLEYRRPLVPLTSAQRGVLVALRMTILATIVLFLFRPIVFLPPVNAGDAIVPVLVDVSRSMRLRDADGQPRLARATTILRTQLLPALSRHYTPEVYGVGEELMPADVNHLDAAARQTNLAGALASVRRRYHGQRVAGIVVLSDGADTGEHADNGSEAAGGPPVFAIGIGSIDGPRDREVLGITAGDPRLDQSSVDLRVSAISAGFGRAPFQLRLLANGRVLESRRVVPPADRSPIEETFTVSPDPLNPTVYAAEIPADESEPVVENNSRSVLLSPAGRKRRVLILEGAPGFEHSFMKRAWTRDPSLEIDSVVRKGKNAEGQNTFFVQAGADRAPALLNGFPARREDLYAYDVLVIANVEGDFFSRAQLALAADFVAERGGGLLVLGGRSLGSRGLIGTALEDVLPLELNDRRSGVMRTALGGRDNGAYNKLVVTPEGENHPIMRVGGSREESLKQWAALPALAASAPIGGPRHGATVLAVAEAPGGTIFPVVAVQQYGQGRSMIFAGEASWRWKMLVASTDRTHEFFWRQAARWLARPSPDPVAISVPDTSEPGDAISVNVEARDAAFAPAADAVVDTTLTLPGGEEQSLKLRHAGAAPDRFSGSIRVGQAGLYRIRAEARRGQAPLGSAERWFYVGGADREFADPRLNEGFLRRVARASGGRYVPAADAGRVLAWLQESVPQNAAAEQRDLWQTPWAFAFIVGLLSAEWVLRRRWGLR